MSFNSFFTDKVESKFIRIFTERAARRVNMSHSAVIQNFSEEINGCFTFLAACDIATIYLYYLCKIMA